MKSYVRSLISRIFTGLELEEKGVVPNHYKNFKNAFFLFLNYLM